MSGNKSLSPRESKVLAERNITNKISILETWLLKGIPWEQENGQTVRDKDGNRVHTYIPDSLRTFNTWCSHNYSAAIKTSFENKVFSSNGTDTLNKYPQHKERVINLLKAIAQVVKSQIEQEGTNKVKQLELEVIRLNLFIKNQASKITELHRDNLNLSKNLSAVERRERGNFDELRKNYSALEIQNNSFREQISLLTKQLKNIHSLKDVKNVK